MMPDTKLNTIAPFDALLDAAEDLFVAADAVKDKLSDEQQGKLRLAVDALTDAMCAILSEATEAA
jgi:hypothetical protein